MRGCACMCVMVATSVAAKAGTPSLPLDRIPTNHTYNITRAPRSLFLSLAGDLDLLACSLIGRLHHFDTLLELRRHLPACVQSRKHSNMIGSMTASLIHFDMLLY